MEDKDKNDQAELFKEEEGIDVLMVRISIQNNRSDITKNLVEREIDPLITDTTGNVPRKND
ncbi:MAG: hypothetical protein RX318_09910 [bacterium]|nr:hypothetical protein [bacterium]